MERPRAFMDDEVWHKILYDFIAPYKDVNRFCPPTFIGHKDGEPLLNKQLPERLKELSEIVPDMKIDIYSHGLMLPELAAQSRDFIEFLGSLPNLSRYLMSYHPFNHDGSANDYADTIVYLQHELRNPPGNIEFITVSHRSKWVTAERQDEWEQHWLGLPIKVHKNCELNPWTGRIEESTVKFNGCPYADFGHWFFGVTGNIIACCLDLEEEIVLGNVMEHNREELFKRTDQFYKRQRVLLAEKKPVDYQVCANCYGQERTDLIQLGVR